MPPCLGMNPRYVKFVTFFNDTAFFYNRLNTILVFRITLAVYIFAFQLQFRLFVRETERFESPNDVLSYSINEFPSRLKVSFQVFFHDKNYSKKPEECLIKCTRVKSLIFEAGEILVMDLTFKN